METPPYPQADEGAGQPEAQPEPVEQDPAAPIDVDDEYEPL
ncbi:MAG TPA: hypothetical protein VGJ07_03260 [Rugosimonospora sp.]|jgi:hypothetical protein